jgi:hypothetical protein
MTRSPFVWDTHMRREVLDEEIEKLQELPYSIWAGLIGAPFSRPLSGRDGRAYRLSVRAAWAASGSRDVRVVVTLQSARLRRRLLRSSFVITPDNSFL